MGLYRVCYSAALFQIVHADLRRGLGRTSHSQGEDRRSFSEVEMKALNFMGAMPGTLQWAYSEHGFREGGPVR